MYMYDVCANGGMLLIGAYRDPLGGPYGDGVGEKGVAGEDEKGVIILPGVKGAVIPGT